MVNIIKLGIRKLSQLCINAALDMAEYAINMGSIKEKGGDLKIYRDTLGNLQINVDADAASNGKAVDIYGGVVVQNHLTVGTGTLSTSKTLYIGGTSYFTTDADFHGYIGMSSTYGIRSEVDNQAAMTFNLRVSGTDTTDHVLNLLINNSEIIVGKATGDGAGGIINKAIGFLGVTPQVQQNHIIDADGNLADITTKFNTLLADLEGYGLLKSS